MIFCALLFVSSSLFAQVNKTDQNPVKIGLVLSGGGAKGLAHIGVLKEIEAAIALFSKQKVYIADRWEKSCK